MLTEDDNISRKRRNERIIQVICVVLIVVLIGALVYRYVDYTSEESRNKRSNPGDYYKDYLKDSDYDEIVIEVDYIEGNRPRDNAMDFLVQRLQGVCEKDSVSWKLDDSIPETRSVYSIEDIQELEEKHRDDYRDEDSGRAVMYYLYLNGEADYNEGALGSAYHGSSIAMFKEVMDSASTATISEEEVERAVLVHEAGHLLGLVDIIHTEHSGDHPDPKANENPNHHCGHEDALGNYDCVMHSYLETYDPEEQSSWWNNLMSDVPNQYCEDCMRDIQEMKDK